MHEVVAGQQTLAAQSSDPIGALKNDEKLMSSRQKDKKSSRWRRHQTGFMPNETRLARRAYAPTQLYDQK